RRSHKHVPSSKPCTRHNGRTQERYKGTRTPHPCCDRWRSISPVACGDSCLWGQLLYASPGSTALLRQVRVAEARREHWNQVGSLRHSSFLYYLSLCAAESSSLAQPLGHGQAVDGFSCDRGRHCALHYRLSCFVQIQRYCRLCVLDHGCGRSERCDWALFVLKDTAFLERSRTLIERTAS